MECVTVRLRASLTSTAPSAPATASLHTGSSGSAACDSQSTGKGLQAEVPLISTYSLLALGSLRFRDQACNAACSPHPRCHAVDS